MTHPFDADDLLKRSIFSSILGFGRKVKNSGKIGSVKDENVATSTTNINNTSNTTLSNSIPYNRKYRTKQEIYDEIVCECAELEKNKTTFISNTAEMKSVACSTSELYDTTVNSCSADLQLPIERNNKTIQNLIQLLVTAVKESEMLNDQSGSNSPEDILKRKRLQNKKAAIRYRKRQKELKEEAELEVTILMNKNNELKNEIKRMQAEIDQLKPRVLKRTSEEAQSLT